MSTPPGPMGILAALMSGAPLQLPPIPCAVCLARGADPAGIVVTLAAGTLVCRDHLPEMVAHTPRPHPERVVPCGSDATHEAHWHTNGRRTRQEYCTGATLADLVCAAKSKSAKEHPDTDGPR